MMQRSVNKCFLLFLFLLITFCCSAQKSNFKSDIEFINKQLSQIPKNPVSRSYIYKNESSILKKINPVGLFLGVSLYLYQNSLSKHFSADCLYTPGCSEFSKQAIKEFGVLKGVLLTADRLNRCNRIAAQDLKPYIRDPVTNRYPDPVSRYKINLHGSKD
jgi:putative membrane protein insertion efficiency factor